MISPTEVMSGSLDRWRPSDDYPDDPDFECKDCGHCFNRPSALHGDWDGCCPECESQNVGGGGYYG